MGAGRRGSVVLPSNMARTSYHKRSEDRKIERETVLREANRWPRTAIFFIRNKKMKCPICGGEGIIDIEDDKTSMTCPACHGFKNMKFIKWFRYILFIIFRT
jgi:DnaJ-class molecular chaperone